MNGVYLVYHASVIGFSQWPTRYFRDCMNVCKRVERRLINERKMTYDKMK